MEQRFVGYARVSTTKQGESGLGLEAQYEAIRSLTSRTGGALLDTLVEVETGKGADALKRRPQLRRALERAKREKATLVIAKLDRLSRSLAFISALIESGVDFVAADNPHATKLTIHILAAVAEHERDMIAQRTRDALAAAKARGVALGATGKDRARENQASALAALAPAGARLLALRAEGLSIRQISAQLNVEGVPSPGAGRWHPSSVGRALDRLSSAASHQPK